MIRGSAFQELGAIIDELEQKEMTVLDVVTEQGSLAASQRLSAEITVGLNGLTELSAAESVDIVPCGDAEADGLVTTTFAVEIPVDDVSAASRAATDEPPTGGRQTVTEEANAGAPVASEAADESEDIPYYKNYDLLARVYEEHDTFAEMTEALGVDVTPATVREHMVNHGIHPTASTTEDRADEESQEEADVETGDENRSVTIEADGYGLPESVTMESLVHAVQQSRTLYEAQTALGLDRSATRDLLADFDLLDLVVSRLSADHSTDLEEVVDRIHASSTV